VISSVCFLIVSQRHLNSQLFIAMSFLFKKLLHQGVLQEAQDLQDFQDEESCNPENPVILSNLLDEPGIAAINELFQTSRP
jgi:hypothetical protein